MGKRNSKPSAEWLQNFRLHYAQNGGKTSPNTLKHATNFATELYKRGSTAEAAGYATAEMGKLILRYTEVLYELHVLTQQEYGEDECA